MSTKTAKFLVLCFLTGSIFIFVGGCGSAEPAETLPAKDAAQLFRSARKALLDTVLGANKSRAAMDRRVSKSLLDIPLSFELDCPTAGSIFCDGTASADIDGIELNFTAGANDCTVFDGISMDGSVTLNLTAAIVGMYVEGAVTGSMTFDVGTPITCDMDLEMYVDVSLEPNFSGTFCGYSVDMLNDILSQFI